MSLLNVKKLCLKLGKIDILKDISFSLEKGEIISILGPSGSGKSSLLRLIAGLDNPSQGQISFYKDKISDNKFIKPVGDRNIGLMFQEDVLFPHMNVLKNISFGLENKNISNLEIKALTNRYINKFGLEKNKYKYPNNLSGGEKQRVALARVLVTNPKILLMDEPFSSLDNNLRKDVCEFTINTLRKKNISVLFVTHDVQEAFKISDRIMIIYNGEIKQIGTPEQVYRKPISKFVASFLSDINQVALYSDKKGYLNSPFGKFKCKKFFTDKKNCYGRKHCFMIRPQDIKISKTGIQAKIVDKFFLGSSWGYYLKLGKDFPILKAYPCDQSLDKNQNVRMSIIKKNILIFED